MKAVLLSIHPQYCSYISKGIKTVEVRKTRPRVDVPFKCYVYCTISKNWPAWSGRVIGEFICDSIINFGNVATDPWALLQGSIYDHLKRVVINDACLSELAMLSYGGRFGWHISDFHLYDKPRPLTEFFISGDCRCNPCFECAPQSWCYVLDK